MLPNFIFGDLFPDSDQSASVKSFSKELSRLQTYGQLMPEEPVFVKCRIISEDKSISICSAQPHWESKQNG